MSYADPAKAPKDGKVNIEAAGVVTSDSLAAESYAQGQRQGDSESHFDAVPHSVPSKSTNTNTTDTANASTLPAAVDRASRTGDQESYAMPGDSTLTGNIDAGGAGAASSAGGSANQVPVAPSYVSASMNANAGSLPGGDATEGGFETVGAQQAGLGAEPGSRKDPGREAVKGFERANARNAADGGVADDAQRAGGQGGFENLDKETAA